jgi:hypothetical protein
MKKAILILFGITLLLPSFDTYTQASQSGLWTYDNHRRYPAMSYDLQFRIGTEINDLRPWTRVRLGFPIKPITVDVLTRPVIIQVRLETLHITVNLVAALVGILIVGALKRDNPGRRNSIRYSTKVWLTNVLLTPLLLLIHSCLGSQRSGAGELILLFLYCLVAGGGISLPVWLLLVLAGKWVSRLAQPAPVKKMLIQIGVLLLTFGVLFALSGKNVFAWNVVSAWLLFNLAALTAGIWMHKIDPHPENEFITTNTTAIHCNHPAAPRQG